MGLDNATRKSGFAIKEDGIIVQKGLFKSSNSDMMQRIEEMYLQIKNIVEEYNIDYIGFENTTFSSNIDTLKGLSFLAGSIFALCVEKDLGCRILFPSEWRKNFGFKGKERKLLKQQAIEYVNSKYGFDYVYDPKDKNGHDDICEAICICDAMEIILQEQKEI